MRFLNSLKTMGLFMWGDGFSNQKNKNYGPPWIPQYQRYANSCQVWLDCWHFVTKTSSNQISHKIKFKSQNCKSLTPSLISNQRDTWIKQKRTSLAPLQRSRELERPYLSDHAILILDQEPRNSQLWPLPLNDEETQASPQQHHNRRRKRGWWLVSHKLE